MFRLSRGDAVVGPVLNAAKLLAVVLYPATVGALGGVLGAVLGRP